MQRPGFLRQRCFSVNFVKFLRTPFLWNTFSGGFCLLKTDVFSIDTF